MEEKLVNLVDELTFEQKFQLGIYALVTLDFGVEVMENGVVLNDEWNERKYYLTNERLKLIGGTIRDILDAIIDVVSKDEA